MSRKTAHRRTPGRDARNEQRKFTGAFVNAVAIALFVAGLFGPIIDPVRMGNLAPESRIFLVTMGLIAHFLARFAVRGIEDKAE
ncbi:MAG TPA: hypothetical protein DCZ49_08695 [Hyphomonadaceae bacterium]|nr:hypothetical protein [Hyphomonadaceae bacterium]